MKSRNSFSKFKTTKFDKLIKTQKRFCNIFKSLNFKIKFYVYNTFYKMYADAFWYENDIYIFNKEVEKYFNGIDKFTNIDNTTVKNKISVSGINNNVKQ